MAGNRAEGWVVLSDQVGEDVRGRTARVLREDRVVAHVDGGGAVSAQVGCRRLGAGAEGDRGDLVAE